jgi:hypothetical protein
VAEASERIVRVAWGVSQPPQHGAQGRHLRCVNQQETRPDGNALHPNTANGAVRLLL